MAPNGAVGRCSPTFEEGVDEPFGPGVVGFAVPAQELGHDQWPEEHVDRHLDVEVAAQLPAGDGIGDVTGEGLPPGMITVSA